MKQEIDRIESAIRHIQTSTDVDPWAAEIAVAVMRKQIADFGKKVERAAETAQNMQDEDLISRQDAIDAIEQLAISEDMCVFEILSHIELAIGTYRKMIQTANYITLL